MRREIEQNSGVPLEEPSGPRASTLLEQEALGQTCQSNAPHALLRSAAKSSAAAERIWKNFEAKC
jgi:hypothetical protein